MKTSAHHNLATFSFITPLENERVSYQNVKRKLAAAAVQGENSFQEGLLLETVEKGVIYPVVHYAPIQLYSEFDELKLNGPRTIANDYLIGQGFYKELASVRADLFGAPLDDLLAFDEGDKPNWKKSYILLGFKHLPVEAFTEVMEGHWKDWTGARYLYLNLPDEFGLSRLTFYKRLAPDDIDIFLYLVLVECVHVTTRDEVPLQDFVQRMRADKMPHYLALYDECERQPRTEIPWLDQSRLLPRMRRRSLSDSNGHSSPDSLLYSEEITNTSGGASSPSFSSPVPPHRVSSRYVHYFKTTFG